MNSAGPKQLDLLAPQHRQPENEGVRRAYLEGRLKEAKTPEEQEQLLAQLRELDPTGNWNGSIFAADSDIAF